ncbi:UNVERIFIED_CONTAM: hypothetical protein Slati_0988000 [Sesamum latifolium]|uniref:Reverse transcriptase zinc-binding domain-containing protein n=1 Tax=Sesamum latifolium TaxID=2727402 RepID=A0AAW2XS91_9LAMI
MNNDGTTWNEELIKEEFCEYDAALILEAPIRDSNVEDFLGWHYNTNGKFSVKSAYDLALWQATISGPSAEGVRGGTEEGDWSFLWKARVPPKIQLFAWKACQEAIPVAINLKKRGVQVEVACSCCSLRKENSLHVLVSSLASLGTLRLTLAYYLSKWSVY